MKQLDIDMSPPIIFITNLNDTDFDPVTFDLNPMTFDLDINSASFELFLT